VVLTMYQGDEDVYGALPAGAVTYLLKETLPDDLIRIIRAVNAGKRPVDQNGAGRSRPAIRP
jgi:DNA-binding NarL/FixJ family response regulator